MSKVKRYIEVEVTESQAIDLERWATLAADYENLSPQECYEYDDLTAVFFSGDSLRLLHPDDSVVCWLPVDGFCQPEDGACYLVTDGQATAEGTWNGEYFQGDIKPTHYAELPVKR